MKEVYKDIIGYEDRYQISNFGNVKSKSIEVYPKSFSKPLRYPEKLMKLEKTRKGYLRVMLTKNCISKKIYVHRLVLEHFVQNTENKPQVNHKNGIKSDNNVNNLEWVTMIENITHYNLVLKSTKKEVCQH